ncbi:hypothetical protein, partial [Sphingomonas sp. R-74633]|uniref:hypothetical protein n=1 Tax=Sphingomonas sp. R-74633 TaxID=2751188 RepID=UPI001C553BB2
PTKLSPWNGLVYLSYSRLEAVRPRAAAHMSLHQNHNVKERKRPTPWLTLFLEGDPGAWFLVTVEAFR